VAVDGLQFFVGFGLAVWLLLTHVSRHGESGAVLLLIYWALNLPVLGQEAALVAWQYPAQRSVTLRLLEPLGAPEPAERATSEAPTQAGRVPESSPAAPKDAAAPPAPLDERRERAQGVEIKLEDVSVLAAGHKILEQINLHINAGEHIGIVGPSRAGKSSLVGIPLGWHRPASGLALVDGRRLEGQQLEDLRRATAWVDPTVYLWNRSLLENLRYGMTNGARLPISQAISEADLRSLPEELPDGLQTTLGEGGALVSGGEGQRVRLARAMLRAGVRLVILDEPFRGLDRGRRRDLLARGRRLWRNATLMCIIHDVSDTMGLDAC